MEAGHAFAVLGPFRSGKSLYRICTKAFGASITLVGRQRGHKPGCSRGLLKMNGNKLFEETIFIGLHILLGRCRACEKVSVKACVELSVMWAEGKRLRFYWRA